MHISGTGPAPRYDGRSGPRPEAPPSVVPPVVGGDSVQISEAARASARPASDVDPLRARRLDDIRGMIENGTYETTERLEAALSRFLAAVGAQS